MQLLRELSAAEITELAHATSMKKGHALKLTKRLVGTARTDLAAAGVPEPDANALAEEVRQQGLQIAELQASMSKLSERLSAAERKPASKTSSNASAGVKKGFFGGSASSGAGGSSAGPVTRESKNTDASTRDSPRSRTQQASTVGTSADNTGNDTGAASGAAAEAAPTQPRAAHVHDDLDVPQEFMCSITKELFKCPVITSDGHSYERDAIKQWLESNDTSPLTGQVLPDKVLRPNHSLRAQIVEFRERSNLPALPPWSPDPQEVVPSRPQSHGHGHGVGGGQIVGGGMQLHMGGVLPPGPGGGSGMQAGVQVQTQQLAQAVANLLVHSPELVQQLVDAGVPEAGTNPAAAINAVMQSPALLQLLMSHPMAQQHFWPLVPQAAMLAGPGVHLPGEPPLFQAAREGEVSVVERLLGPLAGEELSRQVSPTGDSLLHVACWEGRTRLVSMLLARCADFPSPIRNIFPFSSVFNHTLR